MVTTLLVSLLRVCGDLLARHPPKACIIESTYLTVVRSSYYGKKKPSATCGYTEKVGNPSETHTDCQAPSRWRRHLIGHLNGSDTQKGLLAWRHALQDMGVDVPKTNLWTMCEVWYAICRCVKAEIHGRWDRSFRLSGRLFFLMRRVIQSTAAMYDGFIDDLHSWRVYRHGDYLAAWVDLLAKEALRVLAWGEVVEQGPVGFAGIEQDSCAVVVEVGVPERGALDQLGEVVGCLGRPVGHTRPVPVGDLGAPRGQGAAELVQLRRERVVLEVAGEFVDRLDGEGAAGDPVDAAQSLLGVPHQPHRLRTSQHRLTDPPKLGGKPIKSRRPRLGDRALERPNA